MVSLCNVLPVLENGITVGTEWHHSGVQRLGSQFIFCGSLDKQNNKIGHVHKVKLLVV